MHIGEPRRTIYIEPIEEPASAPFDDPRRETPAEPTDPLRPVEQPEPAR